MSKNEPLISIGVIFNKNDLKYLPYSLKSIAAQTYGNFELIMHNNLLNEEDTEADDKVWKWIEKNYPDVVLTRSGNIGFGPAHNSMIRRMKGDFYLCYNPDMFIENDFLEKLVLASRESDEDYGVFGGRLMYWNFARRDKKEAGRSGQIDSLGLKIRHNHQVVDIGQGDKYDPARASGNFDVFGLSGAMFMASRKALKEISYDIDDSLEYFDETIFLYKEDVDLAYRLRLAGYKTLIVNDALAYHDRTISETVNLRDSRKNKQRIVNGQTINTWSFYHHHIMLYKCWQRGFSFKVKMATLFRELAVNGYLFLFEFSTFWNGWKLFKKNFSEIKKRKKLTVKKAKAKNIEKLMN